MSNQPMTTAAEATSAADAWLIDGARTRERVGNATSDNMRFGFIEGFKAARLRDEAHAEQQAVYLKRSDFGAWAEQSKAEHDWWSGKFDAPEQRVLYIRPQPVAVADRQAIRMLVAAGYVSEDKANEALQIAHGFTKGELSAAPAAVAGVPVILAANHKGMRVDYSGLLKQARGAMERGSKEPALAEMLRQMTEHLTELGSRWYAGKAAVVDEFLQLYCIEPEKRKAVAAAPSPDADGEVR